MRISITKTDEITRLDGVAVRVWNGQTDRGIPCVVYVHRIAVADEHASQFDVELLPREAPGPTAISMRHVL